MVFMIKNTEQKENNEGGNGAAINAGGSQMGTLFVAETFTGRFGDLAVAVRDEFGLVAVASSVADAEYYVEHRRFRPAAPLAFFSQPAALRTGAMGAGQ